jgi:hypothetical protein
MSNIQNDITIVVPNLQYKGSTDRLLSVPILFNGDRKEFIDSDRSRNVNAFSESEKERLESNKYRISGKLTQIFSNTIFGSSSYDGFKNYMGLFNPVEVLENNDVLFDNNGNRIVDNFGLKWSGYPQYDEFAFIRYDRDNPHLTYQPQSASSYNWTTYLSYVYSSDTTQKMTYTNNQLSGNTLNFIASDGIPFTIINTVLNGKNYITFRCGGKHNLTPYQYVELSLSYNGNNIFQVVNIGEAGYSNTETTFSILNPGYTGTTFQNGTVGTFKRIANISNPIESRSEYYVRLHKVIVDNDGIILNKMGFENSPFRLREQIEYSALTPNLRQRISYIEGNESYSYSLIPDVDVSNLVTTNNKPVTNVYLTVINRGYTGWFNKPNPNTNTSIQYGWDFNFQNDVIDEWWDFNNLDSYSEIPVLQYNKTDNFGTYVFYYNDLLKTGDTLVGDFCEYNKTEQIEFVISECNHKLSFNETLFQIESQSTTIPEGYFYKPFYEIKLKDFESSLSTQQQILGIDRPTWAYYSENLQSWIWRNVLPPGTIEPDGNGVNYPFLNGAHYTFNQDLFLLTTPFKNINISVETDEQPVIDDCE